MGSIVGFAVFGLLLVLFLLYKRLKGRLPYYRFYWRLTDRAQRIRFSVLRARFYTQQSISESKSRFIRFIFGFPSLLLRSSTKLIFGSLFGFCLLELSRNIQVYQPQSIFINLVRDVPTEGNGTYDGILTTILTFVGIFIPLYLTSLTSAIEEKYSELPYKIRTLILKERIENVAVGFAFFLTAYNLIALVYSAALGSRPIIVVAVAALLGGLSIPMLAAHFTHQSSVFRNPVAFSGPLLNELADWSRQATTQGYKWDNSSFQEYYHQQATLVVQGLQSLADLLTQEGQRKALITLIESISRFLPYYLLNVKPKIPENSLWFEKTTKFNDWYLATGLQITTLMMAKETRTNLPTDSEPDYEWLEKKLLVILEKTCSHLVEERKFEAVYEVLAKAFFTYKEIGMVWQISTAQESLNKIAQAIYQQMTIDIGRPSTDNRHEVLVYLQTVINLNILPVQTLLGFFDSVETIDVAALEKFVGQVNWQKPENIYTLGLPREAYSGLEYLIPKLQFELDVEGYPVSATWYTLQLALQPIAQGLHEHTEHLIQFGKNFYITNGRMALDNNQGSFAVMSLSHGLEFFDKLDHHMYRLKDLATVMEGKRILKDIAWPEWDWSAFDTQIQEANEEIVLQMANCVPYLVSEAISFDESYPDLLGQALDIVGEAYFDALHNNQTRLIQPLFKNYIVGLLRKQESVLERVRDWKNPHSAIVLGTEPFADLLELSGYALLYSEYHQNTELWQSVKAVWDNYLLTEENRIQIINMLYRTSLARRQPSITSRGMLRDHWTRIFGDALNTIELVHIPDSSNEFWRSSMIRNHPSLLIRAIASSDRLGNFAGFGYDAASVFVDLYLNTIMKLKSIPEYHFEDIQEKINAQQKIEVRLKFVPKSENKAESET